MILVVTFSLFIAILLNREIRCRGLFRVAFLLPIIIGTGAVMTALQGNNSFGGAAIGGQGGLGAASDAATEGIASFKDLVITEQLTLFLGSYLSEVLTTVFNRLSAVMWLSGIQIIIFMGALQTIPNALYEAAYCDGATEWEKFWKITLPLTMPTIALNMVYTIVDYSSNAENKVVGYISLKMKESLFAYSSAMAWAYFLMIGIVIIIIMAIMKRRTFYMG